MKQNIAYHHYILSVTFNWTKVELKHSIDICSSEHWKPFNWTKVELKPKKTDAATDALKTFNWTKVELKP